MKKLLLVFILLISLTGIGSADQLAYITKEQAETAAVLLKAEKEVLLFCGCCSNDPKVYLKVTSVTVQHTGYENFWQVIIAGTNRKGEKVVTEVDLAYVHVNRKDKAITVGKLLNLNCDPCVTDIVWDKNE